MAVAGRAFWFTKMVSYREQAQLLTKNSSLFLFHLPRHPDEISGVQQNTEYRGGRRRKANGGQAGVRLDALKIGERQAHQERLGQSLDHRPDGFFVPVEISQKTEKNSGHDGLRGKAAQIFEAFAHDGGVGGENSGEQITPEPDKGEYRRADDDAEGHAGEHRFSGPVFLSGAHVLGDEGRHGLRQGAGNQHGEIDNLAGHAVSGGRREAERVDKCADGDEGQLRHEFLKRQRRSDAQEYRTLFTEPEIFRVDPEGKRSAEHDDR